jgi:hypothetical protein
VGFAKSTVGDALLEDARSAAKMYDDAAKTFQHQRWRAREIRDRLGRIVK